MSARSLIRAAASSSDRSRCCITPDMLGARGSVGWPRDTGPRDVVGVAVVTDELNSNVGVAHLHHHGRPPSLRHSLRSRSMARASQAPKAHFSTLMTAAPPFAILALPHDLGAIRWTFMSLPQRQTPPANSW
jgi:hypothetical protein